ncbi:Uncharacterised protein [Yersinia frederiksenii]|nr:Uncharacterised protein [Yersinia frederiksenii]CNI47418.1 Uncharacterised protein [Yersinia frederiksenii]CNK98504.1 Uncharacterised protein [Yersinia frederiksenii]
MRDKPRLIFTFHVTPTVQSRMLIRLSCRVVPDIRGILIFSQKIGSNTNDNYYQSVICLI